MDPILENTPTRLVVKLGNRFTNSAMCIFDKTAGTAKFERKIFMWPRKPIEVPLGDIAGIDVLTQSTEGSEMSGTTYFPRVHLRSGKSFYLSQVPTALTASSEKPTTEVVVRMCAFLGLPAKS